MSVTRTIDAMGVACPMPLIELKKAIDLLEVGDLVEIVNDDPGVKVDVPVWCRMQRHELVEHGDAEGGGWRFLVKKTH